MSDILIFLLTSQNEYFKQVINLFANNAFHLKEKCVIELSVTFTGKT